MNQVIVARQVASLQDYMHTPRAGRKVRLSDMQKRGIWQVNGADQGKLLGLYVAAYDVGAVYWQDATHLVLADLGGTW